MEKVGRFPSGKSVLVALGLLLLVVSDYSRVLEFDFVSFDDPEYVTQNRQVRAGLTTEGAAWAFSGAHVSNWHPVTWLSHMLDVELFGLDAGRHHAVNVLFHAANTLLLFFLLRGMTGSVWRSGFVAALFAAHPLHIESVAWVSERKDVLSTFFWILTIFAYLRFIGRKTLRRYLPVVVTFAAGLMAKPMLVTLPFTLLILDYWPLARWDVGPAEGTRAGGGLRVPLRTLLWEKTALFALSFAFCAVALFAQSQGGSVPDFGLGGRSANAVFSCAAYLWKTIWPSPLAVFYPHPDTVGGLLPWKVVASGALLAAVSALCIRHARKAPYLLAGWAWFLVTLLPVIGLVQVGLQGMADRYTYVPLIGVFVMIAWGVPDLVGHGRRARAILCATAIAAIGALSAATWSQLSFWKDGSALFTHALEVVPDNWHAHSNLGRLAMEAGRTDEAIGHFRAALRIYPTPPDYDNLGMIFARSGRLPEAQSCFEASLKLDPKAAVPHLNMGTVLLKQGQPSRALWHYGEAAKADPDLAAARYMMASVLFDMGRIDDAIVQSREAIRIRPDYAEAHNALGNALMAKRDTADAVSHFREALRLDPSDGLARRNLEAALKGNR